MRLDLARDRSRESGSAATDPFGKTRPQLVGHRCGDHARERAGSDPAEVAGIDGDGGQGEQRGGFVPNRAVPICAGLEHPGNPAGKPSRGVPNGETGRSSIGPPRQRPGNLS
jgi:hypothetical protein